MRPVIIVESPAKCKKIESFLNNEYECIATCGHIRELKKGVNSIDISNKCALKFITKSNISRLERARLSKREVILATDDDREGEAIAWHVCEVFNLPIPTTKRIIFHEITASAILRAISNPTIIDMNKVHSQLARLVFDRVIGFTISPTLWGLGKGLSAGRCQTPALRLVYDNQITQKQGDIVHQATGLFTSHNIPFKLNHIFSGENQQHNILEFLKASSTFEHCILSTNIERELQKPPTPFTTSTLQQSSSNNLHFSPKYTMKIAQDLYNSGYITYMRTDSTVYSPEFIKSTREYITKKHGIEYAGTNNICKQKSKNAQEAHEAIRPTVVSRLSLPDSTTQHERKLYKHIWKNAVQSCMSSADCSKLTCVLSAPLNWKYKHTAEQLNFQGWKILDTKETNNSNYYFLQHLKKTNISYSKITCESHLKDGHQHYTEAKLVNLLEKKGIGRPSTFSSLIAKIQERGYVKKQDIKGKTITCEEFTLSNDTITRTNTERTFGTENNKLVLQPLGKIVIEFLSQHFDDYFAYAYTERMENELDSIAQGKTIWYELCQTQLGDIKKPSQRASFEHVIDPSHTYVMGRFGPCVRTLEGDQIKYHKISSNIEHEEIISDKVTLDKMIGNTPENIGEYNGEKLVVKQGKYGPYVTYKGKNVSLRGVKPITFENIKKRLEDKNDNSNVLLVLSPFLSIRKGKFGNYIFYKRENMPKPSFFSLKGCPYKIGEASNDDFLSWIENKYNI